MRLFHSYLLLIIFCVPFIRWYIAKGGRYADLFTIPRSISFLFLGYLFFAVLLYILVPTYREHIEPSVTIISLMIADGFPAYTDFSDENVYSILYGPSTYLFQVEFLKLFSNPILGSKIYAALCFLGGFGFVSVLLARKYGTRHALQGAFYFSLIVLLFGQVAFRNQSDSIIFLGNSLAVGSLLLSNKWSSRLLLALGIAMSVSAKFHALGYILPLIYLYYRQHGVPKLVYTGILAALLILSPFLLEAYSLKNFIITMQAYSKLELHYWLFMHNLSMAYVIFLPLLLLIYFDLRKRALRPILNNEGFWTFLFLNLMLILVCLTAAIDGAGNYHIAPFAPVAAVLFTVYHARSDDLKLAFGRQSTNYKTLFLTCMVAWFLAVSVFTVSVQKKYIWFIQDNISHEIEREVLAIKQKIEENNWRTLMGYSDQEGYTNSYYRPLLWSAIKDNSMDPIALMGRGAIGVDIPETGLKRLSAQYYDVVIIPKPGKPFTMYNWHSGHEEELVFGEGLTDVFMKNYTPLIEYKYFVLWRAKQPPL